MPTGQVKEADVGMCPLAAPIYHRENWLWDRAITYSIHVGVPGGLAHALLIAKQEQEEEKPVITNTAGGRQQQK